MEFKTILTNSKGTKLNFKDVAALTEQELNGIANFTAIMRGHSLPVPPSLLDVPEAPEPKREAYYRINMKFDDYDHETPNFAFKDVDVAKQVVDLIVQARGGVVYTDYRGNVNDKAAQTAGIETTYKETYTLEEQDQVRKAREIKSINERMQKDFDKDQEEYNEILEELYALRSSSWDIESRLKKLARIFEATNAIVQDADKTMDLILNDHFNDVLTLAEQMEGFEQKAASEDAAKAAVDAVKHDIAAYLAHLVQGLALSPDNEAAAQDNLNQLAGTVAPPHQAKQNEKATIN